MTENQKLREAFETYITDDGKWPNAILKAPGGQYLLLRTSVAWQDWKACAEALALLTVPAISDTWGISRALVTLYAYECDGATDKALALITADHIPDAGKMIETAAPVGEREAFEKWILDATGYIGASVKRDQEGQYKSDITESAWDAWQGRAALRAGDAVDAQRYRWLMDNCTLGIKQNGVGWSLNTTACIAPDCIKDVGATIDAAMRKGQL